MFGECIAEGSPYNQEKNEIVDLCQRNFLLQRIYLLGYRILDDLQEVSRERRREREGEGKDSLLLVVVDILDKKIELLVEWVVSIWFHLLGQ